MATKLVARVYIDQNDWKHRVMSEVLQTCIRMGNPKSYAGDILIDFRPIEAGALNDGFLFGVLPTGTEIGAGVTWRMEHRDAQHEFVWWLVFVVGKSNYGDAIVNGCLFLCDTLEEALLIWDMYRVHYVNGVRTAQVLTGNLP